MHNGSGNNPAIEYCTFTNNTAGDGGGMYNKTCSPSISNCIFSNNTGLNLGGGIYLTTNSDAAITNCLVINNNAAAGTGGGIYLYASDATDACNPVITNTTIANNSANLCGGLRVRFSTPTLNNCIIWGNTDTDDQDAGIQIYMSGDGSSTTLNYSCYSNGANDVYGTPTTSNCITTNPQFAGSEDYPFSIVGNSPCADAGSNLYNTTSYDIRGTGFSRKLNKTNGSAGTIDMGAYEYKLGNDPLPVELTSFSAAVSGSFITLNWHTATEVNNYGFEIERASSSTRPSQVWEKIGFVQGHGNSNSPKEYSFIDENPIAGNLKYRLKQIDTGGAFEYYGTLAEVNFNITDIKENQLTTEFALEQNYPNPFNPSTKIKYSIPNSENVLLKVFDVLGKEVKILVDGYKNAGTYEVEFDASELTSGLYFYKIVAGNYSGTRKMMLVR